MATFLKRGKDLFEIKEGKPICRTNDRPQAGDQVYDGPEVLQVQADGVLSKVQSRGGSPKHFRSRETSEGGGKLI